MNKAFEKILEFIDEQIKIEESIAKSENEGHPITHQYGANCMNVIKKFVQEVAEEYKGDMKHNLAEMYAKNMVDYGVDVTEAWQTAMQQSCALEKAYIRGRQCEVDRFNKLRKEHNVGWIPVSEKLPEIDGNTSDTVLVCGSNGFQYMAFWCDDLKWRFCECGMAKEPVLWTEIVAWQPLPEPFKESD